MDAQVSTCRVGLKQVKITPPLPCEMSGYFHSRVATSVTRDLYATAMAVESNGQTCVLVGSDLIAMTDELCMPAFARAEREFGVPLANCFASATHTHTGPEIRRDGCIPCCVDYLKTAPRLFEEAVCGALANMFDAVLCVGQTRAPGLAHNRLSRCADGSEIFGGQLRGPKVIGAAGPEDDSVQTLSIYDTQKKLRGVVLNFACHPDLGGGGKATAIDADWPGMASEILRQVHGPDLVCMVLQGTAGDINHQNHRATTKRWTPDGQANVARGVAGAALYSLETAVPLVGPLPVAGRRTELDMPYYTRDARLFELAAELKAKGDKGTYFERELVKRIEGWENDGKVDRLAVSCLRIGDLAFVAMPGEIFTGWGLEIKRYSPAKHTFIAELASDRGGKTGYKPTSDQALRGARAKGAYGALPTLSQRHIPAAGQILTETVIAQLYELWPE